MASTKAPALVVVALLVACGAPPEECPTYPEIMGPRATVQCIENGCGLPVLGVRALGCGTQITPLLQHDDCSFHASYRCANELEAQVVYNETRAFFEFSRDNCVTRYVLSAEAVECATAID